MKGRLATWHINHQVSQIKPHNYHNRAICSPHRHKDLRKKFPGFILSTDSGYKQQLRRCLCSFCRSRIEVCWPLRIGKSYLNCLSIRLRVCHHSTMEWSGRPTHITASVSVVKCLFLNHPRTLDIKMSHLNLSTGIKPLCANCQEHSPGLFPCSTCKLVLYCTPECQGGHSSTHEVTCDSSFINGQWKPIWVSESRDPRFNPDDGGTINYLWGNMPAIDIPQLQTNEGEEYGEDIDLLFAASGDIRYLIKTIANLPAT